ncbi:UDP-N-acetylmuramate--L-alanine ligase [Treponema pectinovorum]|uniref:UDP-N-acetylmuramate--L-alanine ligase n=1 Tax=Treponema pectinovorum TaxID=164 RepID=UPI003D93F178
MNLQKLPTQLKGVHIHCVGIKGTGVVALVEILHARGAIITGSDVEERFYTDEILEKLNIEPKSFSASNITDDIKLVIYSSAYNPEVNPDLKQAVKKNIPIMLYTQALGSYSQNVFSCGVCGVHGKTTTTGLCGTIFKELNLAGQVLAGSIISSFNGCTYTSENLEKLDSEQKSFFIAETCEYQRHFMSFCPKIIILTSVESDHQDYYPTYADIRDAFVDYALKLPEGGTLIFCADDRGAVEVSKIVLEKRADIKLIPYGFDAQGEYKINFEKIENGKQFFSINAIGECAICVPGTHNVKNAVAAIALNIELLKTAGKNPIEYEKAIKKGLLAFTGGKRRSEVIGRSKTPLGQDVIFIDDYGHHPTAIKTTLAGFRDFYKDYKIIVDFMSHTYSRTSALLEDFAKSFESADKVIINKIYGSARENPLDAKVDGKILAEHTKKYHRDVIYCKEFDEAIECAYKMLCEPSGDSFKNGYIFVTMGAGNNWQVGTGLIQKLKNKEA